MKKLVIIIILLISVCSLSAQFTKFGGAFGFTTGFPFHEEPWEYNKSGKFYGSLKGVYELTLPVHISPSFTVFIPHVYRSTVIGTDEENKITVGTVMFDINGHYIINSLDQFEFYALGGLDILLAKKKDVTTFGSETSKFIETDNAIGLNLGIGSYLKITEQLDIFVEAKYLISKYHQFMLTAGVFLNLQWLTQHENPGL